MSVESCEKIKVSLNNEALARLDWMCDKLQCGASELFNIMLEGVYDGYKERDRIRDQDYPAAASGQGTTVQAPTTEG